MSYQQLNPQERLQLYHLRQTTNLSIRGIAEKMGRSHTTIYRELRRNQHPEPKNYLPDTAQSQAVERRQQAKLPFSKFTLNIIENLGLKPRRSTTALPLNTSAFTKYMLKCSPWKKPIGFDFTPHQNKSRYCGAPWAV